VPRKERHGRPTEPHPFKASQLHKLRTWLGWLQGEMADCMYFVAEGVVRIVDPDSSKLLTTITKGSYFGEFALLQVWAQQFVQFH
jgi:CRP-like cAMP-binding protein